MDNLELVLDESLPHSTDPKYLKVLSMKKDAAISALGAGLKADENRFRKRANDVLGQLLSKIKADDQAVVLEQS